MNNLLLKTINCTEDYDNHYKLAKIMNLNVNRNMHPIILRAYVISNLDKLEILNKNYIISSESIEVKIKK